MVGPPMSIFSIKSSAVRLSLAAVASNGYRFTTTRSIGAMPCSFACFQSSARLRRKRSPPCTFGCSVLTRPPSISGQPVNSDTSFTATPPSRSSFAVPPVERISMRSAAKRMANSSTPVLSNTLISARSTAMWPPPRRPAPAGREKHSSVMAGAIFRKARCGFSVGEFWGRSHPERSLSLSGTPGIRLFVRAGPKQILRDARDARNAQPRVAVLLDQALTRAFSLTWPSTVSTTYSTSLHFFCFCSSRVFFRTKSSKRSRERLSVASPACSFAATKALYSSATLLASRSGSENVARYGTAASLAGGSLAGFPASVFACSLGRRAEVVLHESFLFLLHALAEDVLVLRVGLREVVEAEALRGLQLAAPFGIALHHQVDAPFDFGGRTLAPAAEVLIVLNLELADVAFDLTEIFVDSGHAGRSPVYSMLGFRLGGRQSSGPGGSAHQIPCFRKERCCPKGQCGDCPERPGVLQLRHGIPHETRVIAGESGASSPDSFRG